MTQNKIMVERTQTNQILAVPSLYLNTAGKDIGIDQSDRKEKKIQI